MPGMALPTPIMSVDPNAYMYGPPLPAVSQNTSFSSAFAPLTGGATGTPPLLDVAWSGSNIPLVQPPKPPVIPGGGNPGAGGLGFNMPTAQLALTGLNTIGNLWAAFQANKLAKRQFNFSKDFAETNLANQIKSYNTALSDRARSRGFVEGQSEAQTQAYIDQNSLSRNRT